MKVAATAVAAVALIAGTGIVEAQQPARTSGPVIHSAGGVYDVPEPEFETPLMMTYRVAFEVAEAAPSPDVVNVGLATVARFLNMHARAGVPVDRLQLAVVVHGPAGRELLQSAAYRATTGVDNPNEPLLRELMDAGVRIILCGQTAYSRGIPRDRLVDGTQVALSAMTALAALQERGYRVNPF